MEFKFKKQNPDVAFRKQEAEKILEKYPDRIPIICEKDPRCQLKDIDKTKYLVPNDLTLSQFTFIVRKRLQLDKNSAMFLLINGKHAISGGNII
jgi:GABA(A) receptor-associated protein